MNKKVFNFLLFAIFFGLFSCNESKKEEQKIEEPAATEVQTTEKEEIAMAEYQCPMKCEGDKTYPEVGNCPVCKMEIKELADAAGEVVHEGAQ